MMIVAAPGKAILAGEYAVLHGAPAIAVAVDRSVRAQAGKGDATPFVVQAIRHAARAGGNPLADGVRVDSSALYEGSTKLGLGSSAAVTTAVVGLSFARAGLDLSEHRRTLFDVADEAHAEAQGTRGSGVDVACSVYGGTLRFSRNQGKGGKGGRADIEPVELPEGVQLTFLWAGQPASTTQLIGRVKALAESAPAKHDAAIGRLLSQAHAFAAAVASDDAEALVRAADAYGIAMAALGDAAGCAIVTAPHARLAELARRHGGAAKPSGAGGGDLGVAFTIGAQATERLHADARAAGLMLLSLDAPAPGLRLENV
jgi:phosphomevalonate kinase